MVENSTEAVKKLEQAMEAACKRATKGNPNGAEAGEVEQRSYLK